MSSNLLYHGYNPDFLKSDTIDISVPVPVIGDVHQTDVAVTEELTDGLIPYFNYSLKMSKSRKFAFFSASNINGTLFRKIPRKDGWREDKRVPGLQWGQKLYSAPMANFDRGHLTKREDVQWGTSIALAFNAAESTFFYTNAVPQHRNLNRDVWRSLEDYILHTETKKKNLKVCVFTGPVLRRSDPFFVTRVDEASIQLPGYFWKVIIFPKEDNRLYRVGFLMSQMSLLRKENIIEEFESSSSDDRLFLEFEQAHTYQVSVDFIENITGLIFLKTIDSYTDNRSRELIFKEIEIDPDLESESIEQNLGFVIENLIL